MGFFSEQALEVAELYFEDGLKEEEIGQITGLSVLAVNEILAAFEDSQTDYEDPADYAENAADLDAEFYGNNG